MREKKGFSAPAESRKKKLFGNTVSQKALDDSALKVSEAKTKLVKKLTTLEEQLNTIMTDQQNSVKTITEEKREENCHGCGKNGKGDVMMKSRLFE